jgi:hypothetical protein
MMYQQRSVNTDGFTLGSKAKELPRLSDPIGLEQNFGSNEFTHTRGVTPRHENMF